MARSRQNWPVTDPEAVERESVGAVGPAGRFRIYMGAAAGVGKTVAMLDEGWRRHERGADVVIGFVETHGRQRTAELIRDLPIVARQRVVHRGRDFEEMDLEAVLARAPEVVLVDELAHTNVPQSGPHEKRWQDVLTLLDAGIAVVTTMNVQHVESLADAVESITGVAIRERVPDWVVRRADQLELIDSSPEQLRRRMLHGNVYPAEKVPVALNGFFRTENLVALRELVLRFVADESEGALLRFSERQRPAVVWETTERILAAITSAPGSDAVLRRAARLAHRVKGDFLVVHVRDPERDGPRAAEALRTLRRLAEDLDGKWEVVDADDPAAAIVSAAVERQVTQIVVGASGRSRWEELARGSVVRRLLRAAGAQGIDVHVIARREAPGHAVPTGTSERGAEPVEPAPGEATGADGTAMAMEDLT